MLLRLGPLGRKFSEGWRRVRKIDRSGLWEVQGWKHPTLAELEKGLPELRGGKVQVLPTRPRQDIPSLQALPPPPGLGPELLPLGQSTFPSLGKRIALAQGPVPTLPTVPPVRNLSLWVQCPKTSEYELMTWSGSPRSPWSQGEDQPPFSEVTEGGGHGCPGRCLQKAAGHPL